jgi:hypothetical protein
LAEVGEDFAVSFPANGRMTSAEIGADRISVQLDDETTERSVPASSLTAIHGASIRREEMHPAPTDSSSIIDRMLGKEGTTVTEETQYVVALRSSSMGEVWYLVADTFNFRKSLGDEAGYLLAENLKRLLAKLSGAAPQAVLDSFVTAMLAGYPLPPPVDSLLGFLRQASA